MLDAWTLTAADTAALKSFDSKMTHIKAAVEGLIRHFHTGLFLWGEGGTGKSYAVFEELRRLRAKYVVHNSRLTARGLADALERAADDIHVCEDCESMFADKKTAGVLRSALHSQSTAKPPERLVTWNAFRSNIEFIFRGAVIIISNSNLTQQIPEIRAIKTRISVLQLDVTNAELLALMKKIASDGFPYGDDFMTPSKCWQVAAAIQDRLSELRRPLDLRLLSNSFRDYLQWKNDASGSLHWTDLLHGRINEVVHPAANRRADRIAEEKRLAHALSNLKISRKERIRCFKANGNFTSLAAAERAYYRRLQRS